MQADLPAAQFHIVSMSTVDFVNYFSYERQPWVFTEPAWVNESFSTDFNRRWMRLHVRRKLTEPDREQCCTPTWSCTGVATSQAVVLQWGEQLLKRAKKKIKEQFPPQRNRQKKIKIIIIILEEMSFPRIHLVSTATRTGKTYREYKLCNSTPLNIRGPKIEYCCFIGKMDVCISDWKDYTLKR